MAGVASWRELVEFVRLVCWTGWARSHGDRAKPQSVLLIGEPGSGKTALLEKFRVNPSIEFYSDITYQAFLPVLRRAERGLTRFLCVTEFQKVLARRRAVSANFLSALGQAMEEGVSHLAYGPVDRDFGGARVGLIGASTTTSMFKHPYLINDMALDSRAFFVDATETKDELVQLEKVVASGSRRMLSPLVISPPDEEIVVDLPKVLGDKVRAWTAEMRKAPRVRVYGVRTLARFLHLLRGVALANGRDVVRMKDLEELYSYRRLWLVPPPLPGVEEQ